MRPPALARLALLSLALPGPGCDRAPIRPDGPSREPALQVDYAGSFDAEARFFSEGLPDRPCTQARLALRFSDGVFDLRCDVVDGIVEVRYADVGPLDAELDGGRLRAVSESAFVFEGTLVPDSARVVGTLQSRDGRSLAVTLFAQ